MVISYLDSTHHKKPATRSNHVSILRQFCPFMFQLYPETYISEKCLVGTAEVQIKPYIFTEDDIIRLIEQVQKIRVKKNTLLPHILTQQ